MGDRICIRLTDGEKFSPTFYGHWCGLRGLKTMIETLKEPYNSMGGCMCNFIVKIKEGSTSEFSYDIWNAGENEGSADENWGMWTYHIHLGVWTATHHLYNKEPMTDEEVERMILHYRPCLYRTCPCDHYGEKTCSTAGYEKFIIPMEEKLQASKITKKK